MFYSAYTAIKERLNTIESVKNVAWYSGGAVKLAVPLLYIEILPSKTDSLSQGHLQASFAVNIHCFSVSVSEMDGDIRDAPLEEHSRIDQLVYDAMAGFGVQGIFDSLQQSDYAIVSAEGMIHSVQRFHSSTYRTKTKKTVTVKRPEAHVSVRREG